MLNQNLKNTAVSSLSISPQINKIEALSAGRYLVEKIVMLRRLSFAFILGLGMILALFSMLGTGRWVSTVSAASIPVFTVFTDTVIANDGSCTLREAIINANNDDTSGSTDCAAGCGNDTIMLSAGTYTLSIAGTYEDSAATGDLDITDSDALTITGAKRCCFWIFW